jgi:hypothetical protein
MNRTPPEPIPQLEVCSTSLRSIGYDTERAVLAITFKSGACLHYSLITFGMWERFHDAPSLGSFYAHHIKGKFPSETMTGNCPKCGSKNGWLFTRCSDCGCADYERQVKRGTYDELDEARAIEG